MDAGEAGLADTVVAAHTVRAECAILTRLTGTLVPVFVTIKSGIIHQDNVQQARTLLNSCGTQYVLQYLNQG